MMDTHSYEATIKKLPGSEVEIKAVIPAAEFDATRTKAIERLGRNVALPGFRKGHVPEKVLTSKIGEATILEEMAEIALSHAYGHILMDNKIDALGRPQVTITKIALGNPLEFTAVSAIFPEFTIADYKTIAKKENAKKEKVEVTDAEFDKALDEVRHMHQKTAAHDKDPEGAEQDEKTPLPELTDEFVKTLGNFEHVEDFKKKLRERLLTQKEQSGREKKRLAIMEAILSKTEITLPRIIIDQELARMEDEMGSDLKRMGMELDTYLTHLKKTKEDIQKDWEPDAKKRAQTQLIISRIGEAEHLVPTEDELKRETARLRERYPDTSPERIRGYLNMVLTNEKVLEFLEGIVD